MRRSPSSTATADAAVLLSAFGVGGLIAVQSHANGRLAVELGGGVDGAAVAALTSFGSGFAIVTIICAAARPTRRGLARIIAAAGHLRPWHLAGGVAGALLVSSQGLTVGTIGVALFTVAVVAGQTTSARSASSRPHRSWSGAWACWSSASVRSLARWSRRCLSTCCSATSTSARSPCRARC